jgi:hypothetical protein
VFFSGDDDGIKAGSVSIMVKNNGEEKNRMVVLRRRREDPLPKGRG